MLAHNSVDRDLMARDSIELTQYDDVVSKGRSSRSTNSELKLGAQANSRLSTDNDSKNPLRSRSSADRRAIAMDEDDSELLINREDLDLDLDGEEAQFLRTSRRVPVRRGSIPKKAASQLKIAGVIAAVLVGCGGLSAWAYGYGMSSWRFRIQSSDSVEIAGVKNASRAHVMEVAGADIGRNIFFVPLDERKKQLEQIPWVEEASVMRLLPNRIAVTVRERTPVAFAQIGSRISLIDANGVVMGLPADRKTKYSFPVIRGITDTEPLSSRAAAMKIYNRLVSELSATEGETSSAGGANYVKQLSEVDLSDPENVKVTANDPGGTMVVHLGAQDFLPRYKLYVSHIAEWRQQFQNVQSVDLRYEGQVIVNPDKVADANPPRRQPPQQAKIGLAGGPGHGDTGKTGAAGASAKPVFKPVSAKAAKPKTVKAKKNSPQRTQRAQR
ncbi:MAG TPA: FtsQ-type POTRA domain-containing protein [Candidatus Angelobacter sp.]|nr:FtsQ-type POTRA domain-containing protein [Candidatus Angelobacter sp.]